MKTTRAILSGALIWVLVFSLFAVLTFLPVTKDSEFLQGLISILLLIPFALLGAAFYWKKGDTSQGFIYALIMAATALFLDAIITVPLFEMPYTGRGYKEFCSNPLLWILVFENMAVIYSYWSLKIKKLNPTESFNQ
jgi:hypothetical protein